MNDAMHTFEILIGTDKATIRTTRDGLLSYLRSARPDATLAKRGYTTSQIRSRGMIIGSVQELS